MGDGSLHMFTAEIQTLSKTNSVIEVGNKWFGPATSNNMYTVRGQLFEAQKPNYVRYVLIKQIVTRLTLW